jgi:hypothetical protein
VLVLVGPSLGVRVPPGRSPQTYTDRDRAAEFRQGRQRGLLAAATVTWHSDPPAETVTWVLLRENALAPQSPLRDAQLVVLGGAHPDEGAYAALRARAACR